MIGVLSDRHPDPLAAGSFLSSEAWLLRDGVYAHPQSWKVPPPSQGEMHFQVHGHLRWRGRPTRTVRTTLENVLPTISPAKASEPVVAYFFNAVLQDSRVVSRVRSRRY